LRPYLVHGVLKNIASNARYFDSIKVFEIGKVFFQEEKDAVEEENLIFALTGKGNEASGFYKIKGYADEFLKKLGLSDFYFDPTFSEEEEKYHGLILLLYGVFFLLEKHFAYLKYFYRIEISCI